jgi:hypothetical protein
MILDMFQINNNDRDLMCNRGNNVGTPAAPRYQQHDAKKLFVHLLLYPFVKIDNDEYTLTMHHIFAGNVDMQLARPKYLSDQIYNKVLFGEVYHLMKGNPDGNQRVNMQMAGPAGRAAAMEEMRRDRNTTGVSVVTLGHDELHGNLTGNTNMSHAVGNNAWDTRLTYLDGELTTGEPADYAVQGSAKPRNSQLLNIQLMDNAHKNALHQIGLLRFHTRHIRKLIFLTNVHRVMRLKLSQELAYSTSAVIKGDLLVDQNLTEYNGNEAYQSRYSHRNGPVDRMTFVDNTEERDY